MNLESFLVVEAARFYCAQSDYSRTVFFSSDLAYFDYNSIFSSGQNFKIFISFITDFVYFTFPLLPSVCFTSSLPPAIFSDPFETQNRYSALSIAERQQMHRALERLKVCRGRSCTLSRPGATATAQTPSMLTPLTHSRKVDRLCMYLFSRPLICKNLLTLTIFFNSN